MLLLLFPTPLLLSLWFSERLNSPFNFNLCICDCCGCGVWRVAEALAAEVTDKHRAQGLVFPPLKGIRDISARIAVAVADKAYELGEGKKGVGWGERGKIATDWVMHHTSEIVHEAPMMRHGM